MPQTNKNADIEINITEGKTESGIFYRFTSGGADAGASVEREVLVLIMGYGGSLRIWPQTFIDKLARSYNVLTYDNRGTGLSFLPARDAEYTTTLMAQDLEAVVNDLDLNNFHLLGYSMGGCIAIDYVRQYPQKVKSLFLLSTTGGGRLYHKPDKALSNAMANPQGDSLWALYEWTFKLMYSAETYKKVEPVLRSLFEAAKNTPTRPQALRGHSHAFKTFDGSGCLSSCTLPITILTGEDDRLMPAANSIALSNALPQAKLIVVPNAQHGVHIENEDLIVKELQETVARAN